jgi:3-dehydroquinate dehydratase II
MVANDCRPPGVCCPKVLVLHGPSLSALGRRQPEIYGRETLDQINAKVSALAAELGLEVEFLQTNHEGRLIDAVLCAAERGFAGILINPAAYTHTSLALADALAATGLPAVEVHLTNTAAREPVRRRSLTAASCVGTVAGFGGNSYLLGLRGLARQLPRG